MSKKYNIFGVSIDDISTNEITDLFLNWLNGSQAKIIFTPNPEFLLLARKNKNFTQILNQSDLSLPDGIGLKFAITALTNYRVENRQTGIDTLLILAKICSETGKRLVLIGGVDNVASETAHILSQHFPKLDINLIDLEIISGNASQVSIPKKLIDEINSRSPDVLAVALSFGKQECFIFEILKFIPSLKIAIGVGGAFDTISGRLKRAPVWMRKNGFEWLWRVIIEPKRIIRILRATIVFPLFVVWDTLKNRRFWRAVINVIKELL
ncbi:WecB/TagA/CpsF family glycosyltransferase [Candidatus Uhrbacteria bacterium]|nr:WecB/TagA/CpsF family glycosyltransferase [Candidatus Uhrbacteria bacterium]